MSHIFTRKELHDLVWSEPMRNLCQRYGISDRGLAKACDRAGIPVPERGYWNRVQAGKLAVLRPLPPRPPGCDNTVTIGASRYDTWRSFSTEALFGPPPDEPVFEEHLEECTAKIRLQVARLPVRRRFETLHPIIERHMENDKIRRQAQLKAKYQSDWDNPLFSSPFEQRRLQVLNALFQLLAMLGHTPASSRQTARELSVRIGDQHIWFQLEDAAVTREVDTYDLARSNKPANTTMIFRIGARWSSVSGPCWEETADNRLPKHFPEIITTLIVTAEEHCRALEQGRYRQLLAAREEAADRRYQRVVRAAGVTRARILEREDGRVTMLLAQAEALR